MEIFLAILALLGGSGGTWWYWHYKKKPATPAEDLPEVVKQWPWSWLDQIKPDANNDGGDDQWKDDAFKSKD